MHRSPESGGFVPSEPVNPESRESKEDALDAAFERLCTRHLTKFNEGKSGIMLRLKSEGVPEDLRQSLQENGINVDDGTAAKILKVYDAGSGLHEFSMQTKAFDIVEAANDGKAYAKVPKPHIFRDLPVGEDARDVISRLTGKPCSQRVEMFMMDYVPGEDIATILYKEVARRHQRTTDIAEQLDDVPFDELQDRVFAALDLPIPGGKSRDEAEREFEMNKVFSQNAERVFAFLERKGFRLHPAIVEQMENTIALFHSQGLALRDAHHRNFMVVGDYAAPEDGTDREPPQTFVIDYGTAVMTDPKKVHEAFAQEEGGLIRRHADDFNVPRSLKRLTVSAQEKRRSEEAAAYALIAAKRDKAMKHPTFGPLAEGMLRRAQEGSLALDQDFRSVVGSGVPSEGATDIFLSVVAGIVEAHPELRQQAQEGLSRIADAQRVIPIRSKIKRFIDGMNG